MQRAQDETDKAEQRRRDAWLRKPLMFRVCCVLVGWLGPGGVSLPGGVVVQR